MSKKFSINYGIKWIFALTLSTVIVLSTSCLVKAGTNSTLSAADKKERNDDTYDEHNMNLKIRRYLAKKYPTLDTNDDGILSDTEMRDNKTITTIEIKGSDYPELSKNMVQFVTLGQLAKVDTVIIDGVDEIRNFFLPVTTKNLVIKNTTLNLRNDGILAGYSYDAYSYGFDRFNLKKLVLDNVTFGNRFETVNSDAEEISSKNIHDMSSYFAGENVTIKINNCSELEEFKVNVKFDSAQSTLSFDGGDNQFSKLTKEKCSITNNSQIGHVIISSTNTNSFFYQNGYKTVNGVEFNNLYFKDFLIKSNFDRNNDGFLTLEELSFVKSLTMDIHTLGSAVLDVLHDYSDIAKLTNLENLTIELGKDGSRAGCYIGDIAFPTSGNLKNVTIKNTNTYFESMSVPTVESFVYTNNNGWNNNGVTKIPEIVINDTSGKVSTLTISDSDVTITNNLIL